MITYQERLRVHHIEESNGETIALVHMAEDSDDKDEAQPYGRRQIIDLVAVVGCQWWFRRQRCMEMGRDSSGSSDELRESTGGGSSGGSVECDGGGSSDGSRERVGGGSSGGSGERAGSGSGDG